MFLDDLDINVRAAEAEGFHGIFFTTKEAAVSALEELGVK